MKTLNAIRNCTWCGKEFAPLKNQWAQFCSKSCANAKSRAAKRDKLRAQPKTCAVCGKDFIAAKQGGQTICGKECRLIRQRERNRLWMTDPAKTDKRRAHWRKQTANRNADPQRRILANMRTRLVGALKGAPKPETMRSLVGCTHQELIAHLEAQFAPGMAWDNYGQGGWHLDHIVPCDVFDLEDLEQLRACFHYTNLQPLWEADNCSKGARLDWAG